MHKKIETFIRNTGNMAGQGRDNADHSEKVTRENRSMPIITGEDLPRGQSLIGRLFVLDFCRGDVDLDCLTRLQKAGKQGDLAALMATYMQYLAPKMDSLKTSFPELVLSNMAEELKLRGKDANYRAFEMHANMTAGLELFFNFLCEQGAMTMVEANVLQEESAGHLRQALSHQAFYQEQQDECQRFISLTTALFASAKGHISSCINGKQPECRPSSWGWRELKIMGIEVQHDLAWEAKGVPLGFYDSREDQVWLMPETVFTEVQNEARKQGEPIVLAKSTLYRRLLDRGFLAAYEKNGNTPRPETYRKPPCRGIRDRYLVFNANTIYPEQEANEQEKN